MKRLESRNNVLFDMYGCVFMFFPNGLKIKEEKIIEVKKKIIINNVNDGYIDWFHLNII